MDLNLGAGLRLISHVVGHPLNRGGRMRGFGRVLRWQIGSRLLPYRCELPFVEDTRLFVSRGMTGATGNWYCGLHEFEEMGFVLHALRKGDVFVDVGANVGSYTILGAGAVGASVIAVEPLPDAFAILQKNVLLNGLGDLVRCVNQGVGASQGELKFTCGLDTANHVVADDEEDDCVPVRMTTLDDLCGDDVPVLLKIDVEGYEQAVLQGGNRILSSMGLRGVVMETNGSGLRYGWQDENLFDRMRGHGFIACSYDPIARRLTTSAAGSGNTLFVRDMAEMQARATEARRFRLINRVL